MDDATTAAAAPAPPSPMQTIFMIAVLIPIVACYYILGSKIGVQALFMGFLFSSYWGAVRMLSLVDYLPTVFGGLAGIALAWLLFALPTAYGVPGLIVAVGASIVALYPMMRHKWQMLLNPAFIVFLTVATIPGLGKSNMGYADMAIGMLFGAAYARLIVFIVAKLVAVRRPAATVPATIAA